MSTDYSRGLRLAGAVTGADDIGLRQRLEATRVHVTADLDIPGVAAALPVLMANLRRLPLQLSLHVGDATTSSDHDLVTAVQTVVIGIDTDRPLLLDRDHGDALHVHLGTRPTATAAFSAVPDGHGVRLRRAGHPYPPLRAPGTGLGAVLTAAVLTAEVFKQVTGLRTGSMRIHDALDFCPVTLTEHPGTVSDTPEVLPPLALVGAGAIGTAVALILRELPTTGSLTVVDPQIYESPNVTTYSLGTLADADAAMPKVDLIARELADFDVTPVQGTAQDLLEHIDSGAAPWPQIVLGAVDNIPARHELQRIYADLTLDGGTGGQAGTTLALREGLPTGPCIRCYYPLPNPTTGPSAESRLHRTTGLPMERIARGQSPLTEDDLLDLPEAGRRALAPHLGKPVCGLASLLGLIPDNDDDYRPSAVFVAQQAAALIIGALIARHTATIIGDMRDIEYDTLYGPNDDLTSPREPRTDCACQTDTTLINDIRTTRRQ
jgi:molybdopterin/thiamine biosynthesis adenylyltransferase